MFKNSRSSISRIFVWSFVIFSLIQSASPITEAQQKAQRERRVAPAVNTKTTTTPTPTPLPTPRPSRIVTRDEGLVQEARTPTSVVAQARGAETTRTLAELQARISEVLRKPELTPAMVGIKVSSLQTGKILFEENGDKLLRPASNMKLYTVAAALDRLSPDYHFVTSVYAPAKPAADGVVKGDLIIYGRGDPSLAARFNNGDYFKGLDVLAERIAAAGVKQVQGDLVGDESYFMGPRYGSGWEWEDLQWWYGAEVSALTVNDNALDLSVKPALEVGRPAVITTGPPDPLLRISNRVATTEKGSRRDLTVDRDLGQNTMTISGSIPVDDKGYTAGVGISDPAQLFVYLLRDALARKGVTVTGKSRTVDGRSGGSIVPKGALALTNLQATTFPSPVELVALQSPPLSLIAAQTLKPSQNLYTELILRTLGTVISPETSTRTSRTSEGAGVEVVKRFLREAGLNPNSLVLSDGSGLSRNDMITADATLQLLTYMHRHRYASVFRDALPIAGVDGTLRNRFKGTLAENNLRAKTGSLSSAASLSGYVTTAAGETLAFSIMVNNFPEDIEPRAVCIDPIAALLASFAGRS
jgi:D-alanyl-D-alanine carboxypeptidase/D-alanyl-D-alanine-endopeptidase (penicillin-binding protein 4)